MTPITIDVNAWHYRMLHKYNSGALWRCHDLCTYTRAVVMTAFMFAIVGSLSIFAVGAILGDAIAWIVACITTANWIEPGVGIVFVIALAILCLFIFCAAEYSEWRDNRRYKHVEPSALKIAYLSWKDKYCAKINFSDD